MLPLRAQDNLNIYDDALFRDVVYSAFLEDLRLKTGISRVATMHMNEKTALITAPSIDSSKFIVGSADVYDCEIEVNSTVETANETLTLDKQLHIAVEICENDEWYTVPSLKEAAMKEMNYAMTLEFEKYVIDKILNFAGVQTVAAITDAATAKAAFTAVTAGTIGKQGFNGQKVAVLPASMYAFCEELFVTRTTILGDNTLITGELKNISGFEIVFLDDSLFSDPTKAIFAIGKPVDVYVDKAGFMEGMRDKQASVQSAVNFNKIYFKKLHITATIWGANKERVYIAG